MILKRRTRQGQSVIEFSVVIISVLAAFLVFQKYIVRGITGRWKAAGNIFGEGRIYDPEKTTKCATNVFFNGQPPAWYEQGCFDENCQTVCLGATRTEEACTACIAGCAADECSE